ncbi:rRNA 2'-O-methyltransferase fibrillarin-like [Camelus ferus]|uniref:rRNA 2'-O-methyltransferase fibrillarin-like n=1 Tax=Camelus ferus TaxID=419612 RepID=A0A8B8T7T1_CAMFR|nr:rRNA 2'-O-methyltransferase fibrillarin-like [Camelus ferus]
MIVVSEDHSLGRHVSQRSHRTDRSREKPGARSAQAGSALASESARRAGKGGLGGGGRALRGLREGEAGPGVRESAGGGGVGARDSSPGRRQRGAGWGRGGRSGIARGGVQTRPKRPPAALRSVRPRTTRWQETEGKGENTLRRLRGRTRGQGRSYTASRGTRGE